MSSSARITTPGGSDNGKSPVYNSGTDAWDLTALLTAAAAVAGYQPLDSDLTAIAALATTAFGRSVLTLADAAALRTLAGLGSIATQDSSSVTITGGSVTGITDVAVADGGTGASTAAAARTNLGLVIGTNVQAWDADLDAVAAVATTAYGRAFLALADAAAARTAVGTVIGTDVQAYDAELAALAGLVSAADRLPYFTGSGTASLATFTAAGRALVDDADASAQLTTLGVSTFIKTLLDDADAATARTTIDAYPSTQTVNAQTGTTYTIVLGDVNKLVTLSNASAITLTLPQDSDVAVPIGNHIDFAQIGAGQVTAAAGTGATVNATPGLKFRAQYSMVTAIKRAANTWILAGDLSA